MSKYYRVFVDGKPHGGITAEPSYCCVAAMFLREVLGEDVSIEIRTVEPPSCFKPEECGND